MNNITMNNIDHKISFQNIECGDLFGQPPTKWYEKWACKLQKSKTFHWGWFICPVINKSGVIIDWVTSESISTGVDVTRLGNRQVYIYGIRGADKLDPIKGLEIHSEYGDLPYGWEANFWTAIYYIAWYYFKKVIRIPVLVSKTSRSLNCVGWVLCYAWERGYEILPNNIPPNSKVLEESDKIVEIGRT